MYDIIIVGAGTAGLTAAIYGVRAGKVCGTGSEDYGGRLSYTEDRELSGIKEISGFEYAKICMSRQKMGAEIALNRSPLLKRRIRNGKDNERFL